MLLLLFARVLVSWAECFFSFSLAVILRKQVYSDVLSPRSHWVEPFYRPGRIHVSFSFSFVASSFHLHYFPSLQREERPSAYYSSFIIILDIHQNEMHICRSTVQPFQACTVSCAANHTSNNPNFFWGDSFIEELWVFLL